MWITPRLASTENRLVTASPSAGIGAPASTSVAPSTRATYGFGSISAGGGQFQSLCGLHQKVEPQLLSSGLLGAVRTFLPPSEKLATRPALAASTVKTVSPKTKV